jgi:hypothetical protein
MEGAIVDLAEVSAKCADYYRALEAFVGFLGVVFGRPESEDDSVVLDVRKLLLQHRNVRVS